jgi:hypothetical protein
VEPFKLQNSALNVGTNFRELKSFVLIVEPRDNQGFQAQILENTKYETLLV